MFCFLWKISSNWSEIAFFLSKTCLDIRNNFIVAQFSWHSKQHLWHFLIFLQVVFECFLSLPDLYNSSNPRPIVDNFGADFSHLLRGFPRLLLEFEGRIFHLHVTYIRFGIGKVSKLPNAMSMLDLDNFQFVALDFDDDWRQFDDPFSGPFSSNL